ncbi:hypothetical protein MRB53_023126 [Persea americana]|uniref:Uncharacterized protein n=1 Tax=Persea americana TaxID=3435 RepID=A0ACC2L9S5_PERAE|nr:hypothetical protein MRB53_023126 [Persea americana]
MQPSSPHCNTTEASLLVPATQLISLTSCIPLPGDYSLLERGSVSDESGVMLHEEKVKCDPFFLTFQSQIKCVTTRALYTCSSTNIH